VLLIFIQPDCPYSRQLLPVVAGLEPDPAGDAALPVLVTTGPDAEIRALVEESGVRCPVLAQDDVEAATAFHIPGTPAACLLERDGRPIGQPVEGAAGVLRLAGIMPGPDWKTETTPYRPAGACVDRLLACLAAARGVAAIEPLSVDLDKPALDMGSAPNVSVVLCTRDRPGFLSLALECYRRQTYPARELIVVDSGSVHHADEEAVAAAGGRVVRVPPDTPLGAKLNRGVAEAGGPICQKWDDDDWYAPQFLETQVAAFLGHSAAVCRPAIGYMTHALWLDMARWRIITWFEHYLSGATLVFARQDWEACPFREIRRCEDFWFLADQLALGLSAVPVHAGACYIYVRHAPSGSDRGHSWTDGPEDRAVEEYLEAYTGISRDPAGVLPPWALVRYETLRPEAVPASVDRSFTG
jgi:hypothetical protein